MDCIIAAGGTIAPGDPLFDYTNGKPKSLLKIGDRTMLEYVISAVQGVTGISNMVVVGIDENDVPPALRSAGSQLAFLPDSGGLVQNIKTAIDYLDQRQSDPQPLLVTTADIPLLTSDVLERFIDSCRPFDRLAYYNLVSRETLERAFPNSQRTFVKLKGVQVAGGDLALAHPRIIHTNPELWEAMYNARKHAWRLARLVGPLTILKLLTRQMSIAEIESKASRLIGEPVRILNSPYAELAMDVDKPQQVELVRRLLEESTTEHTAQVT
jgi:GTP:adenosylcobinamide-phosphate guanylyltransferase